MVDDDPYIQSIFSRLLETRGYTVECAPNAAAAIALAERGNIAAAVLDLTLSEGESGLDVLAWLRAQPRYIRTPAVILTGHPVLPQHEHAIIDRLGGAYVLYKPASFKALIDYLDRLTGKGH